MNRPKRRSGCIFGPSGSGKSTFIRTINRLKNHQRGQIIVDGVELTHDVKNIEAIRKETGMVFQQFNLFPILPSCKIFTFGVPFYQVPGKAGKKEESPKKSVVGTCLEPRLGFPPTKAIKFPGATFRGGQEQAGSPLGWLGIGTQNFVFRKPVLAKPGMFKNCLACVDWTGKR